MARTNATQFFARRRRGGAGGGTFTAEQAQGAVQQYRHE
jgi:hypothetical protein